VFEKSVGKAPVSRVLGRCQLIRGGAVVTFGLTTRLEKLERKIIFSVGASLNEDSKREVPIREI
jgi:hypothetical protein